MTFRTKQAVLGICFVGLLVGPLAFRERLTTNAGSVTGDHKEARDRYGLILTESAAAAGIDFVHSRPPVDEKLKNISMSMDVYCIALPWLKQDVRTKTLPVKICS